MSTSASETPDSGSSDGVRAAGLRLADEVRALMADLHRLEATAAGLGAAVGHVGAARAAIAGPVRRRWYEVDADGVDDAVRARLSREHGDNSLYRGGRNPLAPPMTVSQGTAPDGTPLVVGEVHVGRGREGPPGRLHGGFLAGLFDDVMSGVPRLVDAGPAVTARLSIRYRRATPIDTDLRFEAWVERRSGRRLVVRARCLADGEVTAEAEALFVSVPHRSGSARGEAVS